MAAPGVTGPERSVLMVLAIMANAEAKCWPPINDSEDGAGITTRCVLSERAVQRAIQQLVKLGHITRLQKRHGVIYTVHPKVAPVTQTGVDETGDKGAGDPQAARPATGAPKQPRTTRPKKAAPSRVARAKSRKAEFHRLPVDWKATRFGDGSAAREVVDRRGQAWAKIQIEDFRAWAANAEDKDGIGRKLDWQVAFAKWINKSDREDKRDAGAGKNRNGTGNEGDGFTRAIRRASAKFDADEFGRGQGDFGMG